jgi:hypothetical protein
LNTTSPGGRFCSDGEKPLPKGEKIVKKFLSGRKMIPSIPGNIESKEN